MNVHAALIFLLSAILSLFTWGVCFAGKELGHQISIAHNGPSREARVGKMGTERKMPEGKPAVGDVTNSATIQTPEQKKNPFDKLGLDRLKTTVVQVRSEKAKPSTPSSFQGQKEIQKERVPLTLEQSINIALEHNLGLQIQAFVRDGAQTRISQAQAAFHPTVGVSLSASGTDLSSSTPGEPGITDESQTVTAFINQALPTGTGASLNVIGDLVRQNPGAADVATTYTGGIGVTLLQPLLRGGRVFAATKPIADAEYELHVQEATLRALALRVVADTKRAYYAVLQAEKQIGVTEQSIERDNILKDTSVGLFEGGLTTLRDVYSAEIDLADDLARLAGNQAELQLAQNNLLDVLGIPIATTDIVLLDKDVSFQPIPLELSTWLQVALENRPEILSIQQQLDRNSLRIRTAENTVLPQFDVFGGYRRSSPSALRKGAAGAFGFELEDWTAGLLFSVPLGNVQRNSELAEAKIDHMRLQRDLFQQQRLIRLEVLDAVITLRRSVAQMTSLKAKIKHSQGKLETARARFALGVANNLDISNSQNDLRDAQTDMLTAIINYNIGLAELEARIASSIQIARE